MTSTALSQTMASREDATYAKVSWRLIPFLFLCYVVAALSLFIGGLLVLIGIPKELER